MFVIVHCCLRCVWCEINCITDNYPQSSIPYNFNHSFPKLERLRNATSRAFPFPKRNDQRLSYSSLKYPAPQISQLWDRRKAKYRNHQRLCPRTKSSTEPSKIDRIWRNVPIRQLVSLLNPKIYDLGFIFIQPRTPHWNLYLWTLLDLYKR